MCFGFVHVTFAFFFFYFINNLSEHWMLKGTGRGSAQIAAAFKLMYFRDAF